MLPSVTYVFSSDIIWSDVFILVACLISIMFLYGSTADVFSFSLSIDMILSSLIWPSVRINMNLHLSTNASFSSRLSYCASSSTLNLFMILSPIVKSTSVSSMPVIFSSFLIFLISLYSCFKFIAYIYLNTSLLVIENISPQSLTSTTPSLFSLYASS